MLNTFPRRTITLISILSVFALFIWLSLRFILLFHVGVTQIPAHQAALAFLVGIWFDLNTLAYLIAPFLLFGALLPNHWRADSWMSKIRWGVMWVAIYALAFIAISEFTFWQEFTTRFNFIAVDYLIYTKEVIGNIQESYPVPLILGSAALIVSLIVWQLAKKLQWNTSPLSVKIRFAMLLSAILLPVLSYQVGNVDQMEITSNQYANELAGNGIFSFFAAARRNELDYAKFYQTIPQTQADQILLSLGVQRHPLTEVLANKTSPKTPKNPVTSAMGSFKRAPKNIVLVSVESLSASYLGAYGSTEGLTPKMDKLISEGLKFENMYATGTRTVRGLDALSLGAPPIPGQAIVHRPDNEHLATIGERLVSKGYETFFIYGGYGVFDNMNAYFKANNYQIIDRTDFDPKSIAAENVWGVADESLFNNALIALDKTHANGKPFFAHIMTTSNHRPFTYPEGRIDLAQGHREGAVKYTDYAIGKFIEDAKSKPWFKDTLFVVIADHCASAAGKTKLPVDKYHIAAFMYNPELIAPTVYKRMASQIDIAPTLLDLLQIDGADRFFGQSLFANENQPARAFISNYEELGYYKNNTLIALSPKRKNLAYHVDPVTLESTPAPINQSLLNEAIALYQTAAISFKAGALKDSAPN